MRRGIFAKLGVILIFILIFAIYTFIKAENFLLGPTIIIDTPENGQTFSASDVTIRGWAKNISLLYLNGRQIFTDKDGSFKESLLLARGYNIIELEAKDKFNRNVKEKREIVLK